MLIRLSKGDGGRLSDLLCKALQGILFYSAMPLMFQPTMCLIIFSCMVHLWIINGLLLFLITIFIYTTVFPNLPFLRKHNKNATCKDLGNSQ